MPSYEFAAFLKTNAPDFETALAKVQALDSDDVNVDVHDMIDSDDER
jgi:hypothetical protein